MALIQVILFILGHSVTTSGIVLCTLELEVEIRALCVSFQDLFS